MVIIIQPPYKQNYPHRLTQRLNARKELKRKEKTALIRCYDCKVDGTDKTTDTGQQQDKITQ